MMNERNSKNKSERWDAEWKRKNKNVTERKKWKKEKQNGKSKSEMLSPIQQNGRESKSEMLLC